MIVDGEIHKFWSGKYGVNIQLPRYGIKNDDGGNIVEVYFKQINILPIPNSSLFKLWKSEPKAQPCYISKSATITDLENKIKRILNTYMYFKQSNKNFTIKKMHVWRYNEEDLDDILALDKKYIDYTSVKIDAFLLNANEEQKAK